MTASEQAHLKLLKLLDEKPNISQRELAQRLGVSLGRTNYLLYALIDKGFVKAENFLRSNRKFGYLYLLTPSGIEAKLNLARAYLQRKEAEYVSLRYEIDQLRRELAPAPPSDEQRP